jgi:hypothetical protein
VRGTSSTKAPLGGKGIVVPFPRYRGGFEESAGDGWAITGKLGHSPFSQKQKSKFELLNAKIAEGQTGVNLRSSN